MIAAIVLAAGKSERMGRPKMDLPWGQTTVIGQVVTTLAQAGVDEIVVVTGGASEKVESALKVLPAKLPIHTVYNQRYIKGEMMLSVKRGLSALNDRFEAALIALGDQPQVEVGVVRSILSEFKSTRAPLIVPSYKKHRGHPWLIARSLWPALLNLTDSETMRDFLNQHSDQIHYVLVDTQTVLQDLDTPADYQNYRK